MKLIAAIASILLTAFSAFADYTLEDISPHFSTNTEIIWQAPTNKLPQSFWTYKKLPRVFSATTISNAIVLASFQSKGFPQPSTNRIVLWADHMEGEPKPPYFSILPDAGEMDFNLGDRAPDSAAEYFTDAATLQRAWDCLALLGLDRAEFVKTNIATDGEWGVYLPRQIEGIQVSGESQGFSFQQFGTPRKIRAFSLLLPNLQRDKNCPTASPQQIIACIRAFKTPSPPKGDEPDYFKRIKNLATARKLTITKITPYYSEGIYGQNPTNNETPPIVCPIAELEAVADFGTSNKPVTLLSPILSSEAHRLIKTAK